MWIKSNYLIKDVLILHRFLTYVNSIFQIYIFFRKIYNSLLEAKQDLKNKNAHITEVCQGKLKNTCGYSFKYLESEEMTYRTLGA